MDPKFPKFKFVKVARRPDWTRNPKIKDPTRPGPEMNFLWTRSDPTRWTFRPDFFGSGRVGSRPDPMLNSSPKPDPIGGSKTWCYLKKLRERCFWCEKYPFFGARSGSGYNFSLFSGSESEISIFSGSRSGLGSRLLILSDPGRISGLIFWSEKRVRVGRVQILTGSGSEKWTRRHGRWGPGLKSWPDVQHWYIWCICKPDNMRYDWMVAALIGRPRTRPQKSTTSSTMRLTTTNQMKCHWNGANRHSTSARGS